MALNVMSATDVIAQLHGFDTIIDARTEDEFALDRLPGAVNWPTLGNQERIVIGTMHKQVNPFEARKRGAAMAARNIAMHLEREVMDKPRDWRPLAYCWRGGKRSGSLALVLDQIGFRTTLVEGGYKAFRAAAVADIATRVQALEFQVVCGTTGSGKTRLLHALSSLGAQVLDLEGLANHRSSVLGAIPGLAQPCQKRFDTLVWDALRHFDANRPVYVESESKKIGNVVVPLALVEKMRSSPCLDLCLSLPSRVALLLQDYDWLVQDAMHFCGRLDILALFRGKATVAAWKEKVLQGDVVPVVQDLLTEHYDPGYRQSMERNFRQYAQAKTLAPTDHSMESMLALAKTLV